LIASGLLVAGCNTADQHFARIINEPRPVPQGLQERFGVIGLLPTEASVVFDYNRPADVGGAMATIGVGSFAVLADPTLSNYDTHVDDKLTSLAFSAVLATAVGAVGGLFAGVPEGDVRRAKETIGRALQESHVEAGVTDRLGEIAGRSDSSKLVEIRVEPHSRLAELAEPHGKERVLPDLGCDSVLMVRVVEAGFAAESTLNPPMAVEIQLEIRVVRAADGEELFADVLQYRGERRAFTKWGANDARLFRRELKKAQGTFAEVIYDELFGVDVPRSR
jgi:hypothetical protein